MRKELNLKKKSVKVRIRNDPYESYIHRICDIVKCLNLIIWREGTKTSDNFLENLLQKLCDQLCCELTPQRRKDLEMSIYELVSRCQKDIITSQFNRISTDYLGMISSRDEVLFSGQGVQCLFTSLPSGQPETSGKVYEMPDGNYAEIVTNVGIICTTDPKLNPDSDMCVPRTMGAD